MMSRTVRMRCLLTWLAIAALGGGWSGCSGTVDCLPNSQQFCAEGVLYWFDSCGEPQSVIQVCEAGCNENFSGCATNCLSHASQACTMGAIRWLDSCGNAEEVIESCPYGCSTDGLGCLAQTGCTGDGECGTGQVCYGGNCCAPACDGRCCGDDGCGDTCADDCASSGQVCNVGCLCQDPCQPTTCSEQGIECGTTDDGCGYTLQCGSCLGTDEVCNASGQCEVLQKFSFFVTSLKALQELSGSQDGFGGDLRYGETGAGAGLRGADKICAAIANRSLAGSGDSKVWRAFLSATDDGNGNQVNAIDRIGDGPWYDRLGRVLAPSKADLMYDRPQNGDAVIRDDFPNEDGVPNHRPISTQPAVDNHDMLTGSNTSGRLYSTGATCLDWTSSAGNSTDGKPRVGHSWPRTNPPAPDVSPPPGDQDMDNWMSALTESGCAPGVNLVETGGPDPSDNTVGSGGGYGGFYCFALTP